MQEMNNLVMVEELGIFFDIPTGLTCPVNADGTPDKNESALVHIDDCEDRDKILDAVETALEQRIAH